MYTIDKEHFPIVIVKLINTIESNDELEGFFKEWLSLYEEKKEYMFIFDTTQLGMPNISYCYKLKQFMNELRKLPKQYLKRSLILVSSSYVKYLLNFIFSITTPLAIVHIYNLPDSSEDINYVDVFNSVINDELEGVTTIHPK